ncbi:NUDIX hydrolase [Microbacterium esteraromaticum]|uniref:NUDIX hydrolase n=1 Tax=Microbacterium esteraromaticum TaxID=57043 RepID=UPI00195C520F|nr:NUDIX domain-containing protein [Microbacterium esteraromaticum]MBM7467184.1 8-oxo-dGTP pyrophosphatase MutT (NUDIX family) [Microbacterium esteraromaticum]
MSDLADDMRVAGTAVVLRDGDEGLEVLLLRRPATGSFPGAWVFPGGRVDPGDESAGDGEEQAALRAAVRETREEAGIGIRDLATLSRWVPPVETPVRFRTWFFLARECGDQLKPNAGEIEEAVWMTPRRAFDRHATGALTLFPPTWVTLHALLEHRRVDDAFASLSAVARYETHMQKLESGMRALWAGDEEHPGAPGAAGARHRLTMGTPPWTYERD